MLMKRLLLALLLSWLAAPAAAQMAMDATSIAVPADRILIGPEFVPRRLDLPNVLVVPVGQTVELAADSTFDYIEVAGTLKVSRTRNTTLRFTHLFVLPGGTLDVGTEADPIPATVHVEFIERDVPIDLKRDPFQWGNGLLNFGRATMVGSEKTSFLPLTGSVAAGSTSVTLSAPVVGWRIGDELLVPDTARPVVTSNGNGTGYAVSPSRRESPLFITAISGATVTLSHPLEFDHLNIVDQRGAMVLQPRLANLTRNIVVRSEHAPPVGTPGHTAMIGAGATWDLRYVEFDDLGRTKSLTLDLAAGCTPDSATETPGRTWTCAHLGTNQIAKYATHFHHAQGFGSTFIGNVLHGQGISGISAKWGLSVHATSDTLVQDTVCVGSPGACIVTEDGPEVRNVFDHNLAAYGVGLPGEQLLTTDDQDVKNKCPGCGGSGFWLRGVKNSFTRNESWNNFRGINLFNQQGVAGMYPSVPGGPLDTAFTDGSNIPMKPIVFDDNVTVANSMSGLELWAVGAFPDRNLISAHNLVQEFGVISEGVSHYLINPTLICTPDTGGIGIHASQAYSTDFTIEHGGKIEGCAVGIHGGGGTTGMLITGPEPLVLQNEVNIDQIPVLKAQFTNVMHVPFGTHPHQYILFGAVGRFSGTVWHDNEPLPNAGVSNWRNQIGSQWVIENWQGTGQNYRLFDVEQLGSNAAMFSFGPGVHELNCVEKGLTVLDCWLKYGMAWGGDVLKDAEKVDLDGVVNGFGRVGLGITLGPPRAIVSWPTLREPAPSYAGVPTLIRFSGLATGDLSQASPAFMVSVDGAPPFNLRDYFVEDFQDSSRGWSWDVLQPGLHTVKVWLTQQANPTVLLAGSEMTGSFCVGPACLTTVPILTGLTPAQAAEGVRASQLTVDATTTQATSDTVPAGQVIRTVPAAGARVAQQSAVTLVMSLGSNGIPQPPPVCVAPQVLVGNLCITPPPVDPPQPPPVIVPPPPPVVNPPPVIVPPPPTPVESCVTVGSYRLCIEPVKP